MGENDHKQPLLKREGQTPEEAHDTQHKEFKPSVVKFKWQTVADLSRLEKILIMLSILDVPCSGVLASIVFKEVQTESAQFTFAIVWAIAVVFLPVYTAHGVFMRMPYSLALHYMFHVVLMVCGIVYYEQSKDIKKLIIIVFLSLSFLICVVEVFSLPCLMIKYWQARTMRPLYGAETYNQDVNVKHLFAMSLLLLDLHLELTFVVLVLKIDETGLTPLEIVKLVVGVIYSIIMCVLGFLFLFKKWKPLVFIIPLASLIEVAYITYNLINAVKNWEGFPDEVVPAFIIAVSSACLAVMFFVCLLLIYIYKNIRTEVDNETASLLQPELGE